MHACPPQNICENAAAGDVEALLSAGLLTALTSLRSRTFTDPDVERDLESVRVELQKNWRQLSTFERYDSEVRGGHLEWGLLHDTKFFKEHARKFEEGDFVLVSKRACAPAC